MRFHTVTDEEIRAGRATDVYFSRTREILERRGENPRVRAEFVAKSLPDGWEWAVVAGLEEALKLGSDLGVSARGVPEGSLFRALEPVLEIEAPYRDFCVYETALLGFLCQASGVATRAARCRLAAGDRLVLSFGARRLHPSVAGVVERAAYIGGCDGVATVAGAERIGIDPSGTMPHAL
ncbi:MAG: nicotinate phosphoribosyltransferase, partial [Gemmatimonadota bacterium]|nr:nicotinate phosphoribosyltransferase [Gemmatimonadota bacterium]